MPDNTGLAAEAVGSPADTEDSIAVATISGDFIEHLEQAHASNEVVNEARRMSGADEK